MTMDLVRRVRRIAISCKWTLILPDSSALTTYSLSGFSCMLTGSEDICIERSEVNGNQRFHDATRIRVKQLRNKVLLRCGDGGMHNAVQSSTGGTQEHIKRALLSSQLWLKGVTKDSADH